MDKRLIADRINRLAEIVGRNEHKADSAVNAELGKAIKVSAEAIRQWRKGDASPKLEHLEPLAKAFNSRKVETSVGHILLGLPATKLSNVDLLERLAEDGEELELLRLFRSSNHQGRDNLIMTARAIQQSHPRPANVVTLPQPKKRR